MPTTYTKIADVVVGAGGAATIEFTSIPQTFTDLAIKTSARSGQSAVAASTYIYMNGGTVGQSLYIAGDGATPSSSLAGTAMIIGDAPAATATANVFGNFETYIPSYRRSTSKSYASHGVSENNATTAYIEIWAGLWSNSAAITSITLAITGSFVQHSTATLYGINNS